MVCIDLEILSEMANISKNLSNEAEDTLGRLQMLNNEMSYDTDLLFDFRSQLLLQGMSDAISQMRIVNDMLSEIKNILIILPQEYQQIENSRRKLFEKNIKKLKNVSTELKIYLERDKDNDEYSDYTD